MMMLMMMLRLLLLLLQMGVMDIVSSHSH